MSQVSERLDEVITNWPLDSREQAQKLTDDMLEFLAIEGVQEIMKIHGAEKLAEFSFALTIGMIYRDRYPLPDYLDSYPLPDYLNYLKED